MKSVMGLVNLQKKDTLIKELTENRPIASIPFAGRYRIIDFALSSMVNSGIGNVGVLLPEKSRSVLDHLRSGKDWDLARHHDGLCYLPPPLTDDGTQPGNLKNCYYNLDFINHSTEKYILLANGSVIYNMDFSNVLRFHQNTGADITMVYNVASRDDPGAGVVLETAENGLVTDIALKPAVHEDEKVSMCVYLMTRQVFIDLVRDAFEHGGCDFLLDAVMRQAKDYAVYGYAHDGYVARITSTISYYQASMDVLEPEVWEELFLRRASVYTKIKDRAPVQYKETARVTNSLVANGCIVRGEVDHSILFRGVEIEKGVKVQNSIIMQCCVLQENALAENVICDKNVVITRDKWLKGAPNYPLIVGKNIVI